ncbi:MAG: amidohydrolase [Alphaproteobacteria bacterium]|nr:amidohydrolase [Alphaproteobacteria bacterium]NNF25308.1 amidohydrolase [Paracoccaceae bacterium]
MPVRNRFAEMMPDLLAWRRDFHENPELLFDVHRTAGIVAENLRGFGCDEVVEGIGRTGVVGVIHGRTRASGRSIGLRADMDALPIAEATGAPYASRVPGMMHACGHDGHTTMVLGAARYLAETRNFDGTVVVIFQPAEEGGGGGREMVEDGLMKRFGIDEVYGMHNVPGRAAGTFAIRPGAFYAAADEFKLRITGKSGHAATPHETTDAVVIAAQVIMGLQALRAREFDPVKSMVISVTTMQASSNAHNVISDAVTLGGTVRTMDEAVRDAVERRMAEVATGIAGSFGGAAELDYMRGYPVMVNAETETAYAAAAARAVTGECADAPIYMWGEDFGFMLNECPGAYIHLGVGDVAPLHTPGYDFNDEVLPQGCSWFVEVAEQRLPLKSG